MSTTKPVAEAIDFVSYTHQGEISPFFSECERIDGPSCHAPISSQSQSLVVRFRRSTGRQRVILPAELLPWIPQEECGLRGGR
jgi:hypothetical protein